jgi:signal recognition particle subunit SRP54
LSAVAATESPIIFIGSGEHFNDLESFDAQSFIKRLLGLGDVSKLFNTVKDAVSPEEQSKMLDNLKSGNFTLNDLKSQY